MRGKYDEAWRKLCDEVIKILLILFYLPIKLMNKYFQTYK